MISVLDTVGNQGEENAGFYAWISLESSVMQKDGTVSNLTCTVGQNKSSSIF